MRISRLFPSASRISTCLNSLHGKACSMLGLKKIAESETSPPFRQAIWRIWFAEKAIPLPRPGAGFRQFEASHVPAAASWRLRSLSSLLLALTTNHVFFPPFHLPVRGMTAIQSWSQATCMDSVIPLSCLCMQVLLLSRLSPPSQTSLNAAGGESL